MVVTMVVPMTVTMPTLLVRKRLLPTSTRRSTRPSTDRTDRGLLPPPPLLPLTLPLPPSPGEEVAPVVTVGGSTSGVSTRGGVVK